MDYANCTQISRVLIKTNKPPQCSCNAMIQLILYYDSRFQDPEHNAPAPPSNHQNDTGKIERGIQHCGATLKKAIGNESGCSNEVKSFGFNSIKKKLALEPPTHATNTHGEGVKDPYACPKAAREEGMTSEEDLELGRSRFSYVD